jgi:outer membrane protein insertion porin family
MLPNRGHAAPADRLSRWPGAALRQALAVMLVLASLLLPGQGVAQDFRFGSIAVEGNERIETRTILTYLGISPGQTVSAGAVNDGYQRLLGSGLFDSVEVTPRGGTLVVTVRERPTINAINFEGNRLLKAEQLVTLVQSQPRRIYSPAQAETDAATITEAYAVQNRLSARVTPKIIPRPGNRVDLVFEIVEGRVVEIERLSFVGNRAFTDRRLRQVLETKQAGLLRALVSADTYNPERLEVDKQLLRDFYLSRGYVDFQVTGASAELQQGRDGFFVTFTVREGQRYSFGRMSTVSAIPEADAEEFGALVRIREGSTYTPIEVENTIARMEALALRKGINFLRVDPRVTRNDRDLTLDIEFQLVRGPRVFVERIDIEGNTTTLDSVIRRQFRTVEGDPFNPREIREAAERIRALNFFSRADVNTQPGSSPDQVIVKTEVAEEPTGTLSFGASYGASAGLGFSVNLSERNFLGRGQFVSLDLSLGTDDTVSSFTFREPAFLGRDLTASFNVLYTGTRRNFATYDTREFRVRPAIEFPISERGRLQLRYTLANTSLFNVDAANGSPVLVREEAMGTPADSAVGYTFSWDTRRGGLDDRNVMLFEFSQDYAGIGGGLNYLSSTARAVFQTRVLNDELVLRAELEGGALNMFGGQSSRATERFSLDGKMRGFEPFGVGPRETRAAYSNQDALGGNFFAVARLEAEFPLGLPEEYGIRGGVFADIGSVWGLNDTDGGAIDDSLRWRSTIGVSVFWDTPIGPLRFNFSKAIQKETYDREQTFDFSISTRF